LGTQQLVRFCCLASPLAASTPLLALERLILTARIQIRPLALQRFCSTPTATSQLGLVAEDVEKVNPDLVVRDQEGKPYRVRYDQVNAMLLNEFLKEHRKVQKLETNDAEQQREIKALVTTVKEQAAQIQKVSAQLELNRLAPQTVLNNR
jgi:uncharacterized coiled-coil protein SlyX